MTYRNLGRKMEVRHPIDYLCKKCAKILLIGWRAFGPFDKLLLIKKKRAQKKL